MKNITVGIVGAGTNTKLKHIPHLQKIEGVDIRGICNRTAESSEKAAREFGIPQVYDNWNDMVHDKEIDAIIIGTWPYMHHTIAMAALDAGKHVMCEARMAMNAAEAKDMLKASQKNPHLITQVVPSPFSFRVDKTIKRLLSEKFIGDLLAVEIRDTGEWLDREAPLHWRHDREKSGENIMSLGIWYECLMRWIGTARSVSAMGNTFVKMRRDSQSGDMKSIGIPDYLSVSASMECGALANMIISTVSGGVSEKSAFLFGSKGTIKMENDKIWILIPGEENPREIPIPNSEAGFWRVEEEFINAIRGEENIAYTTFTDGVKYMQFVEAVNRSMDTGRTINI